LESNAVGGDLIFTGGDSVEEANGLAGIDGDLRSRPFQGMKAFEGWWRRRSDHHSAVSAEEIPAMLRASSEAYPAENHHLL
jgi:hypothetical protein